MVPRRPRRISLPNCACAGRRSVCSNGLMRFIGSISKFSPNRIVLFYFIFIVGDCGVAVAERSLAVQDHRDVDDAPVPMDEVLLDAYEAFCSAVTLGLLVYTLASPVAWKSVASF